MKKRILASILALVMVFSFVACGSKTPEIDKAKASVEGFLGAVKAIDGKKAEQFVAKDKLEAFGGDKMTVENIEKENGKHVLLILKGISYKFKSGEIKDGDTKATLVYEINSKDFQELIVQIFTQLLEGKEEVEIMNNIDLSKIKDKTRDINVPLVKEGEDWKVDFSDEFIFSVLGVNDIPQGFGQ